MTPVRDLDGEPAELIHLPRLCTDDLFTLRRAALQGIGAVLIPHLAVANDLESGALIRLLLPLKAHVGIMHAVFHVAAWNASRGARAPRPPLRDCAPAPELASQHGLYF
jgi:DNA-binding transcriptional LysR family regulator